MQIHFLLNNYKELYILYKSQATFDDFINPLMLQTE